MTSFPWINLVLMLFSTWVALAPRFRTDDVARNWRTYRWNLAAAAINSLGILYWLFNWITA